MLAAKLLVLFLPPVLSLAAPGIHPKLFCLASSILALLLIGDPWRAVLLWVFGMTIAVIAIRERIHQLRAVGVRQLR